MKEKKNLLAIPSEQQLIIYRADQHEYLALDWYSELMSSGDMLVTFTEDMRMISTFLSYFKQKVILAFAADARGMWFAYWAEPYMSGAAVGVWIREDKRQVPSAFRLLVKCYDESFKVWPTLVGLCKQEHLKEIHLKLGYREACVLHKFWNGNDVTVYELTHERWKKFRQSKSERQV